MTTDYREFFVVLLSPLTQILEQYTTQAINASFRTLPYQLLVITSHLPLYRLWYARYVRYVRYTKMELCYGWRVWEDVGRSSGSLFL